MSKIETERLLPPVDEALDAMKDIPAPDPARQAAARQTFLETARRLRLQRAVSDREAVRHRGWIDNLYRIKETIVMTPLAKAFAVVVLLSGLATGTAAAADSSLPGQPLYPVDLAVEQVQTALQPSTQARFTWHLRLADERADELAALAERGHMPAQGDLDRLRDRLQSCLDSAVELDDAAMLQALNRLAELTGRKAGRLEEAGLSEAAGIMQHYREQAQYGMNDAAGFRNQMRGGAGWQAVVETPEPTDAPTAKPTGQAIREPRQTPTATPAPDEDEGVNDGPDRDRERDQLHTCQPGTANCQPTQDRTRDQDRDRSQDGTCDGDGAGWGDDDCVPDGDGEHQGPPPDSGGQPGGNGGGGSGGSGGNGGGGGGNR